MQVTERAKQHLKESLEEVPRSEEEKQCYRMVQDQDASRFKFEVDVPGKSDAMFEHSGEPVLAVAPEVVQKCEDLVLDLDPERQGGPGFVLMRDPSANTE